MTSTRTRHLGVVAVAALGSLGLAACSGGGGGPQTGGARADHEDVGGGSALVGGDRGQAAGYVLWMPSDPRTIRAAAFEVVDHEGRIRARLGAGDDGSVSVDLAGPDGVVREGWGPGHSGPYRAACTISTASARMLIGSLTGLGAGPIPWA